MPIDTARLWRQVALGEDTDLELKEVVFRRGKVVAPRRDALADKLAAFGNAGGGRMVLGVTDAREAQGLNPAELDVLVDRVAEICTDTVFPAQSAKRLAQRGLREARETPDLLARRPCGLARNA